MTIRNGEPRTATSTFTQLLSFDKKADDVDRASCPRMPVTDILGTNCDECLSMVKCSFTSTETVRLIRTESPGRPTLFFHTAPEL